MSPAGEHYLLHVSAALSTISAATDDLRQRIHNNLYVHSAPSIASLWLMPRLHRFAQAYPDVSLNLSATHMPSDFALGQVDVDIRYGIPEWGDLVVEPLFVESILPLANPAFIKAHKLKRVEQLLEVPLIQNNMNIVQWSDWFARFTPLRAPERFSLRFDRTQMSLDAATQGLGVALDSAMNAGGHLADGRLEAPFGMDKAIRVKAHFAVYPERHAKRPAVAAFLAWLHAEAAKT